MSYIPNKIVGDETLFKDEAFDSIPSSLGRLCKDQALWVRANQLAPNEKMALFDTIEPNDILQGGLGDCWLLSAISALAEFPTYLENIFLNNTLSVDGKYVIKLYDASLKRWIEVTIDDRIPCKKINSLKPIPLYSRMHDNEIYVLLLEKAFAKMSGSYENLNGGHPASAWLALTGCENIDMWSRENDIWHGLYFNVNAYRKTPWNFQKVPFSPKNTEQNSLEMFDLLKESDESNFVMEAAIINRGNPEHERPDGLIELHAYSLISIYRDEHHQLVQLRNPWGDWHEWKGEWADDSESWELFPEIKKKLNPEQKNDGLFWMSVENFMNIFNNVQICKKSFK